MIQYFVSEKSPFNSSFKLVLNLIQNKEGNPLFGGCLLVSPLFLKEGWEGF